MPAKKAAKSTKKTVKKPTRVQEDTIEHTSKASVEKDTRQAKPTRIKKSYIIFGLVIVILAALIYFARGLFVVAMVNGRPITRLAYYNELENQSGKQTLNTMVTKEIIMQEAQKRNISVSDAEINAELKTIEDNLTKQGQTLNQVLALQGMTREGLIEQLKFQLLLNKMVKDKVKISDKDIDAYLEQNKESIPEGTKPEDARRDAQEQLKQQKTNDEIRSLIDSLQKNAKINYYVQQ